jgi:hypothetical protein
MLTSERGTGFQPVTLARARSSLATSSPRKEPAMPRKISKVSEKKRLANQRNAHKSTGPKTAEGKKRSKLNAVTHGVFCQEIILMKEDQPLYKDLRRQFIRDLKPQRMIEMQMVDKIVECTWKQRRLRVSEATQYELELRDELADKGTTWEAEMARNDPADYCAPVAMTRMLARDEANLEHYSRLDQRLQNMIHRCLKELRTLQESAAETAALPDSPFEETVDEVEYKWATGWDEENEKKKVSDTILVAEKNEANSDATMVSDTISGSERKIVSDTISVSEEEASRLADHASPSPLPSACQGEGMKAETQNEPTEFRNYDGDTTCDPSWGRPYRVNEVTDTRS